VPLGSGRSEDVEKFHDGVALLVSQSPVRVESQHVVLSHQPPRSGLRFSVTCSAVLRGSFRMRQTFHMITRCQSV